MDYAIIAAGEGSRLAKAGFSLPKPMVRLHDDMLIDRLIGIFLRNGAESIRVIINETSASLDDHLAAGTYEIPLQIVRKSTPSSLHSFYELLQSVPTLNAVCLTTTDTVFKEDEFRGFISAFEEQQHLDALMAVTTFIDDESPLFVSVDDRNAITAFTDRNHARTPFVSGGMYCLRSKALAVVKQAVESGTSRMRNFQRQLLTTGLTVQAYPFSKIVDVDHVHDIETARNFLLT